MLGPLKHAIENGQNHGIVRKDISADSLMLLGFGAIVYRFDMADSLLTAMGLVRRQEARHRRTSESTASSTCWPR